jgi:hypothetical protein
MEDQERAVELEDEVLAADEDDDDEPDVEAHRFDRIEEVERD